MKEIYEIRFNQKYAHLLFDSSEGRVIANSVREIQIEKNDVRFNQIPMVSERVRFKYDSGFYYGWQIKRKYTKKELEEAQLFQVIIKSTFEPAGEETGTTYDEATSCNICGSNRTQIGALQLSKNSIPKKDIAITISGEMVLSDNFKTIFKHNGLKGIKFEQIFSKGKPINFFQPNLTSPKLQISKKNYNGY